MKVGALLLPHDGWRDKSDVWRSPQKKNEFLTFVREHLVARGVSKSAANEIVWSTELNDALESVLRVAMLGSLDARVRACARTRAEGILQRMHVLERLQILGTPAKAMTVCKDERGVLERCPGGSPHMEKYKSFMASL